MKIGVIVPGFSADEQDWCIPALVNFVRRLAVDHSVHVFALEYPYRRNVYWVGGVRVHSMGGCNRGKWYAPRLWSDTLSAIRAEHRRARFDLLHAFWINEPGALAALAGRMLDVPVVASVAGGELVGIRKIGYGGQLRRIERTMASTVMRTADQATVGSRYLHALAIHWRAGVRMLPLGVDTEMFTPHEGRRRSLKILNVGSLVPVKGQTLLLQAFAQLTQPDACLEIVGSGVLESELRDQARTLGIASRVAFSGLLAHDELTLRYRAADLFVQSSLHEAQGMAVLEAAACGLPIAGTPVGVVPELAATGGAAVTRGFCADDLTAAIVRAFEAREEMGQNARRAAEQTYSLEARWNGWMQLYRQLRRV